MRLAVAVFTALIFCTPVVAQNAPSALTVDDVIALYKAGISENVLIVRINQSNKPLQPSTQELLKLAQAKVPDGVIQALMNPGTAPAAAPAVPASNPAAAAPASPSPGPPA